MPNQDQDNDQSKYLLTKTNKVDDQSNYLLTKGIK